MLKRFFLVLFAPLAFLFGCKTTQFTKNNLPDKQIRVGGGGGFTGHVTEYIFLENGQVFKHYPLREDMTEIEKLKKKVATELFIRVDSMQLDTIKHSHPGNMYYYVQIKKDQLDHKITWGNGTYPVIDTVQNLAKELLDIVGDEEVRLPMRLTEE